MPVYPPILILDGEQRAALAAVRSLGRQGFPVYVGSAAGKPLAGGSRYCAQETRLPDPATETVVFVSEVANLIERIGAQVLLPITEASALAVLEHADRFPRIRIPMSGIEHFRRASDKAFVLDLAQRIGIDVPAQWIILEQAAVGPDIPQEQFPVVLKPGRSVVGPEGNRSKVGVAYARTPSELEQERDKLPASAYPLLIQSRITGPGLGVFLLRWDGKIQAVFAHQRIREFPPSGGVSTRSKSVALPGGLLGQSEALLAALDWSGVAMVEFKRDTRSGRAYLMEVNPRFWGSLQLAIDAGVDFPWYLVQLALGQQIERVDRWRVGITSRWGWGEIDHLIARLRHSREKLQLPADAPGILRTLLDAVPIWRRGQHGAVFRLSDLTPAIRESFAWLRGLKG